MEKKKIKKIPNKKHWEQGVGAHLTGFLVIPVHIKAVECSQECLSFAVISSGGLEIIAGPGKCSLKAEQFQDWALKEEHNPYPQRAFDLLGEDRQRRKQLNNKARAEWQCGSNRQPRHADSQRAASKLFARQETELNAVATVEAYK